MNSQRPAANPAVKGAVIALIFLIMAVFILIKVFDDGDGGGGTAGPGTDSTAVVSSDSTLTSVSTTLTTPTTIPRGNIQVVVANASRVAGSAGRVRDNLVAQGFTVTSATNAVDAADVTTVYYREGYDTAAADVATILGAKTDQVALMPVPEPSLDQPITPQVHILVMLGKDLAK